MSYCRWSECGVYAYECEGGVQFYTAGNRGLDRLCNTFNEAYHYAKSLRDEHGLDVPEHAIRALREDALDDAKRFNGPYSAVAAVQADNERLRQELAIREESEQEKCIEYLRQENIDWEDRYRTLANESAKLHELADAVKEFIEDVNCSECPMMRGCDDNNVIACHERLSFHALQAMYKLGIEVDE